MAWIVIGVVVYVIVVAFTLGMCAAAGRADKRLGYK